MASLNSGGYVAGNGDALRFVIHPSTGPVRLVERSFTPVRLAPDERAIWLQYANSFTAADLSPIKSQQSQPQFEIPQTKPAYRELLTDNDGRIWVGVYAAARKVELPPRTGTSKRPRINWRQPQTYEVFSNVGAYLGRVELPMRAEFRAAQGDRLWLRESGESDEDVIRVYAIITEQLQWRPVASRLSLDIDVAQYFREVWREG